MPKQAKLSKWYLVSMFVLAVAALVVTLLPYVFDLSTLWETRLDTWGKAILFLFLLDFIYFWYRARWSWQYVQDNWVSLLVLLSPLKALKALKGFKGLKALKGLKAVKVVKLGKKVKKKLDA